MSHMYRRTRSVSSDSGCVAKAAVRSRSSYCTGAACRAYLSTWKLMPLVRCTGAIGWAAERPPYGWARSLRLGGDCLGRDRCHVEQLLEQLVVALDGHAVEPPVDEHVVDADRIALDDDVGIVDRAGLGPAVDDGRDLVADAELEPTGRRHRREHHAHGVLDPAGEQLVRGGRRAE